MARPVAKIDKKTFEGLCGIQCTERETCDFFDVTDKTLNSWCRREYGKGFSDIYAQKKGVGKVSLRRMQWQSAEKGNVAMQIFLGKNILGQSDNPPEETGDTLISINTEVRWPGHGEND